MELYKEDWKPRYRVYSPQGKFIKEITFDFGNYRARHFHNKHFYNNKLIGIFERKDTDDILMELKKMELKKR